LTDDEALSPFSNFRFFGGEPDVVVVDEEEGIDGDDRGEVAIVASLDMLLRFAGDMMMKDDDGEPGAGIG
jgi:hypothetical protein